MASDGEILQNVLQSSDPPYTFYKRRPNIYSGVCMYVKLYLRTVAPQRFSRHINSPKSLAVQLAS